MNAKRKPVCVGFKAHMGWVNAVVVDSKSRKPRPVHAGRIDLIRSDDREIVEPYHVAGGWHGLSRVPVPKNPAGVVDRGRKAQAREAVSALSAFQSMLTENGFAWQKSVVLTARGRLGDLDHILSSHTQIHVAEGEAIRDATRNALTKLGIDWVDQDEKSTLQDASRKLEDDPDDLMKALKPEGVRKWGKEERTVALAAWLHRM